MAGLGSPPHTWRILLEQLENGELTRITSTYVENTLYLANMGQNHKDHLHIRGEYLVGYSAVKAAQGSPPHTWRIPSVASGDKFSDGITSTYVENTL